MLKKFASAEKVEVQAKVAAKIRTSDLHSTLTSTSACLLDLATRSEDKKEGGGFGPPPS
jgi:hypothetical protein